MFPFWDGVVAPLLEAAGTRNLVEIGALRGENTRQIIEHLGPECVLHVIDPAPDFDPTEHQERFGGQYVFHRALSLDVLGDLGPMDAALIDGDHNWYTVYNELQLLRKVARDNGAPLPVLILHDVGWPYGRRDLYYEPSDIPAEFRQPHRRAGMRPGRVELLGSGGMSAGHWNAEREGGPRNGVMTALEDFLAEHDEPHELLVIPIYFGLAIVIETERLERQPALAEEMQRLTRAVQSDGLLELAEDLRLRAVVNNHTTTAALRGRVARLQNRYLETVMRALVNEFYLEHQVRLSHLAGLTETGGPPNEGLLRDPVRNATVAMDELRNQRRIGGVRPGREWLDMTLAPGGRVGLEDLVNRLDRIDDAVSEGDLAIIGSGRGGTAVLLRAYLEAYGHDDPGLWVADRFATGGSGDLNSARDVLHRFDLLDDRVRFLAGDLAITLPDGLPESLSVLYVGDLSDDDASMALEVGYPRLIPGGLVVMEGSTAMEAAGRYRARHGLTEPLSRVGVSGSSWIKVDRPAEPGDIVRPEEGSANAPLAPPAPADEIDLTVVLVVYNMRREAHRTLHSLSRAYQRDIDDLDYEVVVVDNGSIPDQRLGEEAVSAFGPEFRYLQLDEEAHPSPVFALNRGVEVARGRAVALMIDGAHVLTPGVLRYGMLGLRTYEPAIVATQAWYLGPGQQGEAMRSGYDQAREDALLDNVAWPTDGYRLFEIGHFIGDRDWLEGVWESNCLFVTREQLQQVGGFDEAFAMPGGGYANLDLYERLGSDPRVEIVTILGEGSFHQVHGGTTTNLTDPQQRRTRVHSYTTHYAELRGRPFIGPEKPLRFVGAFETNESKRTRARRITARAFEVDTALEGDDGPLDTATPVPEDLRDTFIKAYWRGLAWRNTDWVGQRVHNAPTDLLTYQEILAEVRPGWIVDTGTRNGGRAWFLATICDLLGHGQVVSVGPRGGEEPPQHPRITYVTGAAQKPEVIERVHEIVGSERDALVILGTRGGRNRMRMEFDAYEDLVGIGSYVIVEHTMLNGWPVDASFGKGPFETVRGILATRSDFVVDHEREKHSLTFNPYGFLRRIT